MARARFSKSFSLDHGNFNANGDLSRLLATNLIWNMKSDFVCSHCSGHAEFCFKRFTYEAADYGGDRTLKNSKQRAKNDAAGILDR